MKKSYSNEWITFYPKLDRFALTFGPASYFDSRWHIHCFITQIFSLLCFLSGLLFGLGNLSFLFFIIFLIPWGGLYINLPIRSNWDESDPPRYGIHVIENSIWFSWGCCEKRQNEKRYYVFYFPWSYNWFRTSVFRKDGEWEHETRGNRKDFYQDKWKNIVWSESYPFTYVLASGKIQNRIATLKIEEREWRWRWFMWMKYPRMLRKTIDISFEYGGAIPRYVLIEKRGFKTPNENEITGEVGERTGTWKGGTLGCGYPMLKNETPEQTLRRMEKERKFN